MKQNTELFSCFWRNWNNSINKLCCMNKIMTNINLKMVFVNKIFCLVNQIEKTWPRASELEWQLAQKHPRKCKWQMNLALYHCWMIDKNHYSKNYLNINAVQISSCVSNFRFQRYHISIHFLFVYCRDFL